MEGRVGRFCVRSKAYAALPLFHVVNILMDSDFFLSNHSVDQIATLERTSRTVTPRAVLVSWKQQTAQPCVLITYFLSSFYLKYS